MFRIILLGLLLSGCMSRAIVDSTLVSLSQHSHYQLSPPPASMVGQGFLTLVKGRHQQNDYELLIQVELHADSMVMVGTTTTGMSLFEVVWHQHQPAQLQQSMLAKDIEVNYLLADFQLVHWPLALINQQLRNATVEGAADQRLIQHQQQKIIEIDYQPTIINFTHHLRDYQLTLTILQQWNLE